MPNSIPLAILFLTLVGCGTASVDSADEVSATKPAKPNSVSDSVSSVGLSSKTDEFPNAALQELSELLAKRTRLRNLPSDSPEKLAIVERRREIHENELGSLKSVADHAVLECSEEPRFGQPSYGVILYATATENIDAEELLLFSADSVFRTNKAEFRPLRTTYEGWYFRPDKEIQKGTKFVVACIQDSPEEIENVKNGFMPNSNRARNPDRAYRTQIHFENR